MNSKIKKVVEEIERTKIKITELQTLLPELERKKTDLENNEIIRLVRSASVEPGNLTSFVEAYRLAMRQGIPVSENPPTKGAGTSSGAAQEDAFHEE